MSRTIQSAFFVGLAALVIVGLLFAGGANQQIITVGATPTLANYLPVVLKPEPTPTFTATPTATAIPTATATPTNTPTATAAPTNVVIEFIMYNPDGDDVQGEFVRLRNIGSTTATMTNWTLRDVANHVFTFPVFTLQPQATVRIWTKGGANTGNDLYWGQNQAIWNNNGDTAFLRDNNGQLIDSCSYPGGGMSATCN